MVRIVLTAPIRDMLDIHKQNNVGSQANRILTNLVPIFPPGDRRQAIKAESPVRVDSHAGTIYE